MKPCPPNCFTFPSSHIERLASNAPAPSWPSKTAISWCSDVTSAASTPNLVWMLLTKRPQEFRNFLPKEWLKAPRSNVWLSTMEHRDYLWRIEELLKTPAVVHGISVEPMLGPITLPPEFLALGQGAWVITGGESGPGARPSRHEWFRNLRNSCVNADVPFFFKQWGEHGPDLVRIGKQQAGRVLDGREWDEFPLTG